ncbi:MAG: sigma-70 family RNA polymerase sigma factor, partial [Myxococcota bacterium]
MQASAPIQRERIAALYERYGRLVENRCRFVLRDADAAQDAMQEVFVKVIRNLDQFREEASPSTWILRIATNHCLNRLASERAGWRKRFRQHVEHVDESGLGASGIDPERAQ